MVPAPEPRSRWRLTVSRGAEVAAAPQQDVERSWGEAFERSGLPMRVGSDGRPRLAFGAPLPLGMIAGGELIDIILTERWPRWRVREGLEPMIPDGWSVHGLRDVWLGAPSLAASVAAADYLVTLSGDVAAAELEHAIRQVLAAEALPRERARGVATITYDLRPLLIEVSSTDPGPPTVISIRTRIHPTLGHGRPEEVVGALGDALGRPLGAASMVRERLVLGEDLG